MDTRTVVLAALLAALSLSITAAAIESRANARAEGGEFDGVAHIADLPTRHLLDHHTKAPAPAPAPIENASAPAPGQLRNVSTFSFATYGNAVNPDNDITGRTVTSEKNAAQGYMCVTFGSTTSVTCENEERPVPGCCTSQGADAVCNTFDNGGRVSCSISNQPYPACCENRNQPRSVCTLPASDKSCNNDYPVPGCCNDQLCTVFKSGDSVTCSGNDVARCCPS